MLLEAMADDVDLLGRRRMILSLALKRNQRALRRFRPTESR